MRFTEEGQRGTVRLTVAGVRRYGAGGSLWQELGVRFNEEGQRGTVRLTVAGVRSEVHRGGSARHC